MLILKLISSRAWRVAKIITDCICYMLAVALNGSSSIKRDNQLFLGNCLVMATTGR